MSKAHFYKFSKNSLCAWAPVNAGYSQMVFVDFLLQIPFWIQESSAETSFKLQTVLHIWRVKCHFAMETL